MKTRIRLLTLAVWITSGLLVFAGLLIVLGIFNESLDWDLFGPKLESILQGVFASCIALAFVGLGLTLALGTQEIVRSFLVIRRHFEPDEQAGPEASRGAYGKLMLCIVVAMTMLISALAGLNHVVQRHRSKVFRRLVTEQFTHFEDKLASLVDPLQTPPRDHVPYELYDMVKTFNGLTFVRGTTLYLPDPADETAMWGYTAWREYKPEDGFARFFVAKDFEKAMRQAVAGDASELGRINAKPGFTVYHVVNDAAGKPVAVLRIDGNQRESFREYPLGS